jgi:calpain-5
VTQAKSGDEMEETTESGLIKGHAYAVTAIRKVRLAGGGLFSQDYLEMIQLRNPWGPGIEWKGSFSDGFVYYLHLTQTKPEGAEYWFDVRNVRRTDTGHV